MRHTLLGLLLSSTLALTSCGGDGETTTYEIPGQSMEPSFTLGEEVTVELDAYDDSEPKIGDVVTFHPPSSVEGQGPLCPVPRAPQQPCPRAVDGQGPRLYLKRVVALPGDKLAVRDGQPIVNGEAVLTDEIQRCSGGPCNLPEPIIVPPGHYFLMGDNSGASDDSRFWGPIPLEAITGRVSD